MMPAGGPYRPRLVLRLGVTGHRPPRLDPSQHALIAQQCRDLITLACEALNDIRPAHANVFSEAEPQVKFVSSLAEGADVIAAEAALDSGARLVACLPFPPDQYARDFGEEEWARTQGLIDKADAVSVLEEYAAGSETAYELAGHMVLAQCDILIAVWDGDGPRGRGGTTHIVSEAVAMHQPVIHIDANGREKPQLLWSGLHDAIPDRPSLDGVERADAATALPDLIAALCMPPGGEDGEALQDFVKGQDMPSRWSFSWPLLLALTGSKPWSRNAFVAPSSEQSVEWMRPHVEPFGQLGSFGRRLQELLIHRFGRADSQANKCALRFRSSFVTNFALAGLAVLLALSGLLFPEAKKVLITAELLVIVLIIVNTQQANRGNLHKQWLDRRNLAERLRLLSLTSTLGRLSLRDVEDGTRRPGWVSWYARATAREMGLVNTQFSKAYLTTVRSAVLALINEQVAYHRHNAHSMEHANHRLHTTGDWLFIGTIVACVGYLAASIASTHPGSIGGFGLTEIVTFVTALFPALAAALYGIRMQGDFAATGERSSVIARQLAQLKNAIERDPLTYDRLADRSRRLGEIMLAEVEQWRLHYETRPLSLPG